MGVNVSFEQSNLTEPNDDSNSKNDHECIYVPVDFTRFMLIIALGTPCACMGMVNNLILCIIFGRSHHVITSDLYFAVLAALDTAFCVMYIFLMTMDAISLYLGFPTLYAFYVSYAFPMFAIGRMIQLAAVYMVVAATIERWFVVRNWSDVWSTSSSIQGHHILNPNTRSLVVLTILAASVCLKAPAFWEYTVEKLDHCANPFGAYQYLPRLAAVESYTIFNFYVMNVVQIFFPFILLAILNVGIIRTLRRRLSLAKKFLFPIRYVSDVSIDKGVPRQKLKSATYTLVAVVSGYLIANMFHTVVTALEYFAKHLCENELGESYRWYTISSDVVSIFTNINTCIRLPLYCLCSRAFRREVFMFLCCREWRIREKRTNGELPSNNHHRRTVGEKIELSYKKL